MMQTRVIPDEAIFGSPELSEFCGPIEVIMNKESTSMTDNHSDDPNNSPPSDLDDPDGADLLNLISTSLDRFNALLHTTTESPRAAVYNNPGIPIPNYTRPNTVVELGLSENFSNSNQQAFPTSWLHSDFPRSASPSLVLSSLSGSPLHSSSSLSGQQQQKRKLPSPPGLPRLASQPPFGQDFDSNNSRSQVEQNSVFFKGGICGDQFHRQPPDSCSSLSEIPVWESQWATLPSEMGMLSVDSGIGSESVFNQPWLFSSSTKTNWDHCSTTTEPVLRVDDLHASFDFGSCNDNAQQQQMLLQDLKTALPSPSSNNEAAPKNAASSMLRSMLWSSWPMPSSTQNSNLRFVEQTASSFNSAQFTGDVPQKNKMYSTSSSSSMLFQPHGVGCSATNRRKTESSFSGLRSAPIIGQLGSPPPPPSASHHDLDQAEHQLQSKSLGNSQKFGRDMQSRMAYFSGKSGSGCLLSSQPSFTHSSSNQMKGHRNGFAGYSSGKCSRKQQQQSRTALVDGLSSSSSTSSAGNDGKAVIAKWRRACSFYLRGHCKKEDCEFAHDLTKVTCKFWELGECFKGSTCPFLHGYPPELLEEQEQSSSNEVVVTSTN